MVSLSASRSSCASNSSIVRIASLLVVAVAVLAAPTASAQKVNAHNLPKRIVGDYGYWSRYQVPAFGAEQINYNELTHINHAGVGFNADGSLSVPDGFLEPELLTRAHAAGVKVLLLLGGDFNGIEASGAIRTLVANINAFEKQYHYDGVDIDWEYPESTTDRNFLVQLMARLRNANSDYVLSVYVAPWGGYGYAVKKLMTTVDYFSIMMYDCAGPWTAHGQLNSAIFWNLADTAPYECQPGGSVEDTANIFLAMVPAEQLNMGTPFYGYHYLNIKHEFEECPNDTTTADGACDNMVLTVNYAPTLKKIINKNGWKTTYDPVAYVPYMTKVDGSDGYITYDDAFSTYFRTWYSDWERGMGGTFMWSLDADYDGHSQDLLDAMYQATVAGH
jgi:chitinase